MGLRLLASNQNFGVKLTSSAPFPKIINGDGAYSGAPARIEDPDWSLDNAVNWDRKFPARVPAAAVNSGSDYSVDIDLGSVKTVWGVGVGGYVKAGSFPTSFITYYKAATPYVATGFSSIGTFSIATDNVAILAAPISARYIRVTFVFSSFGAGFDIGKFYVIANPIDLGFLYAGASYEIVTPQIRTEGFAQQPQVTFTGPAYKRVKLDFRNIDAATLSSIQSLMIDTRPFLLWDPIGGLVMEVLPDESFPFEHVWSPPDRYSFSLSGRQLS